MVLRKCYTSKSPYKEISIVMNQRIQEKRNTLRTAITRAVEHYLGHAEDVQNDHITVDMDTAEVGYQSHLIDERNSDLRYYNVLDLIERDGCWFKPDKMAIEALAQSLYPCSEVAEFSLNLKNTIIKFLDREKPTSTRPYKVNITITGDRISFIKENDDSKIADDREIDSIDNPDDILEQELNWVCFDEYPMRKFVRINDGEYFFDDYQLTKATLNYIEV